MIGGVNPATIIVETIKPPPELQQPVQQQQQLQPMPAPLIKQVQARDWIRPSDPEPEFQVNPDPDTDPGV